MRSLCIFLLTAFFAFQSFTVAEAADISRDDLRKAVKELLRDEPDLVMDVIRENSEIILEVAQQGNMMRKRRALTQQWQKDLQTPKNIVTKGRPSRGNPKAPVTIAVFSDYTCTYCSQAEFLLEVLLETRKNDIQVVFFHYPKEQETSLISAKYALAASLQNPDKGWKLHQKFFKNIQDFEMNNNKFILTACEEIGLDYKQLRNDMTNNKAIITMLAENKAEADRLNVTGTPHFFVNDIVVQGLLSAELFEQAIDMALKVAKK